MTRVLFWKELREQWVIALALVLAGTGVLAVIALWQPFGSSAYNSTAVVVHKAMALFFAWGFGLVAGAQPFAGEREVGTLAWLDALPTNRHCLWIGKCLPTVLVVSVQVMALATVSACLGYTWDGRPGLFALLLLTAGFSGLASGLFGSTVSGSQLGALGWAVLAQVVVSIVAWQVSVAASWNRWLTALPLAWMVVPSLAILLIPVVISRHLFTRPDRNRWPARQLMTDPGNWMALSWLVWQQGRWPLLVALVIVAIIPFALPQFAPMYWPLIGLPLGVLCGVSTFAPDRLGDAHRFLGDRRLPLGQIWLVKVGLWLVVVTAAYVPLEAISPAFMRATGFQQPPMLGAYEVFRGWLGVVILALGPLYGFAIGQFCGLLCRKSAVAAALALLVAGALTVVWVPSMAAGGLHWWQWLGPPLVLIAATRLLMRPWVSGRLSAWPSVALVIASLLLAAAGVAVGLWYRVAEGHASAETIRRPFGLCGRGVSAAARRRPRTAETVSH
jgi:hypothetical protein